MASRVDETPTYRHQSLAFIFSQCDFADDTTLPGMILSKSLNHYNPSWDVKEYGKSKQVITPGASWMGALHIPKGPFQEEDFEIYGKDFLDMQWMTYGHGERAGKDISRALRIAKGTVEAIRDIMNKHSIDTLHSDSYARFFLMAELMRDPLSVKTDTTAARFYAQHMMEDTILAQCAAMKITYRYVADFVRTVDFHKHELIKENFAVAHAVERMFLSSVHAKSRSAHEMMSQPPTMTQAIIELTSIRPADRFDISSSLGGRCMNGWHCYKVMSLWFIIKKGGKHMFIIDRAGLDQLRLRMWSNFMAEVYSRNYRLTGDHTAAEIRPKIISAITTGKQWIQNAVISCWNGQKNVETVARHMRIGQTAYINEIQSGNEMFKENIQSHTRSLAQSSEDVFINSDGPYPSWFGFLCSLDLSYTRVMDISYLFHLLPSPDADIADLHSDCMARLNSSNTAQLDAVEKFMRYAKSFHLCKAVKKYRGHVGFIAEEGYNPTKKQWWHHAAAGHDVMPPEDEWGKAQIFQFFPYVKTMEFWHLSAGDVTHVISDMGLYLDPLRSDELDPKDANEILYTLRHGNKLSYTGDPTEVRDKFCNSGVNWDVLAVLASKAESTKYGSKIRETYSADDKTREIQSEIDRNCQHICSLSHGPSMRVANIRLGQKMHKMARMIKPSPHASSFTYFTAQDVSSWSPHMDRQFQHTWNNYCLSTTRCPPGMLQEKLWKNIHVVSSRRGFRRADHAPTGSFMGFGGTADTAMHATILAYTIREAKKANILTITEFADTLAMIDDAVFAITINGSPSDDTVQARIKKFQDHMIETYKTLGFEIDEIKTIVSSLKFTYLNRIFVGGTEVMAPLKIVMKTNREITTRFSSVFTQTQAVFNSAYAASDKGADPWVMYAFSLYLSSFLAYSTTDHVSRIQEFYRPIAALAPRFLGGWGFPTLAAWLTKSSTDSLTDFFSVIRSNIMALAECPGDEDAISAVNGFTDVINRVASLKTRPTLPHELISFPYAIRIDGVRDSESVVSKAFMQAARRIAQNPQMRLLLNESSELSFNLAVDELLKSSIMDAAVVEKIGACGPMAALQSLLDKAKRNEIVVLALNLRERDKLKTEVRTIDRTQLVVFSRLISTVKIVTSISGYTAASALASYMRDQFHKSMEVTILNHTSSSAFETLIHTNPEHYSSGLKVNMVTFGAIQPPIFGDKIDANMYDGRVKEGAVFGVMTRGSMGLSAPGFRLIDPAQKAIVTAAATCMWLAEQGCDPEPLWTLITRAWLGQEECSVKWNELGIRISPGMSSKRLSSTLQNTAHPIGCFPNTQGCVRLDLSALGRIMDRNSARLDFVSVLQCARGLALLDRAISSLGKQMPPRHYAIEMTAISPTVTTGMAVVANDKFDHYVSELKGALGRSKTLAEQIRQLFEDLPAVVAAGLDEAMDGAEDIDLMEPAPDIGVMPEQDPMVGVPSMAAILLNIGRSESILYTRKRLGPTLLKTLSSDPTANLPMARRTPQPKDVDVFTPEPIRKVPLPSSTQQMDPITAIFSTMMTKGKKALKGKHLAPEHMNLVGTRSSDFRAAVRHAFAPHEDRSDEKILAMILVVRSVANSHARHRDALEAYVHHHFSPHSANVIWNSESSISWQGVYDMMKFMGGGDVGRIGFYKGIREHRIQEQWNESADAHLTKMISLIRHPKKQFKHRVYYEILRAMAAVGPDQCPPHEVLNICLTSASNAARLHLSTVIGQPVFAMPDAPTHELNNRAFRFWCNNIKRQLNDQLAFGTEWAVATTQCYSYMAESVFLAPRMSQEAGPSSQGSTLYEPQVLFSHADDDDDQATTSEFTANVPVNIGIDTNAHANETINPIAWAIALVETGRHEVENPMVRLRLILNLQAGTADFGAINQQHEGEFIDDEDVWSAYYDALETINAINPDNLPDVGN